MQYSPPQNVRVYALQITGPLIRIIGDMFDVTTRVQLYHALNLLLSKAGDALRPFLPQLQTTFIRALKDTNKGVRAEGGQALVHVVALSARIDNVLSDLAESALSQPEEVQESVLGALQGALLQVGARVQEPTIAKLTAVRVPALPHA